MSLTVSGDLHFLPLNSELTFSCCQFSTFQLSHIYNYSYGKIMVEHSLLVCMLCPCLCMGEETQSAQKGRRALRAPAHPVHHHTVSALPSCFIFLLQDYKSLPYLEWHGQCPLTFAGRVLQKIVACCSQGKDVMREMGLKRRSVLPN